MTTEGSSRAHGHTAGLAEVPRRGPMSTPGRLRPHAEGLRQLTGRAPAWCVAGLGPGCAPAAHKAGPAR
jgi:hypothetical protein